MRLCPFAQRTILTLNAKQIDYEVINIDLVNKPEWLPTKSIFGTYNHGAFRMSFPGLLLRENNH